jgi:hypothetical protein
MRDTDMERRKSQATTEYLVVLSLIFMLLFAGLRQGGILGEGADRYMENLTLGMGGVIAPLRSRTDHATDCYRRYAFFDTGCLWQPLSCAEESYVGERIVRILRRNACCGQAYNACLRESGDPLFNECSSSDEVCSGD